MFLLVTQDWPQFWEWAIGGRHLFNSILNVAIMVAMPTCKKYWMINVDHAKVARLLADSTGSISRDTAESRVNLTGSISMFAGGKLSTKGCQLVFSTK